MNREIVEPTLDEQGYETHPSFGNIVVNRSQVSPPGTPLFDSDLLHSEVVSLRIRRAVRKRDLSHDWIFGRRELIEVQMSLAQWASLVSSFGDGGGVSCTLRRTEQETVVPEAPYAPRTAVSMAEVHGAADKAFEAVREAFEAYKAHKTAGNLRRLENELERASSNIAFPAEQLTRHVETVVQHAKGDIEAMVVAHARQLGLDAADIHVPALDAGTDTVEAVEVATDESADS